MKKNFLVPVIGLAAAGLAGAQGLYNIMPYDDEPADSMPIHWTVKANIGWDENPSPFYSDVPGFDSEDTMYLSGSVQANFVSRTPQTTWDVWGRVGVTYYLDDITQTSTSLLGPTTVAKDDTYFQAAAGVNFVHRVNERLRLRSRSNVSYEQEPDYDTGIATDRRQGSYLRYSSDNSVGYRWTERLGTVTGWRINGTTYDEVDNSDYVSNLFYNEFRYRVSPATVLTAAYRYGFTDNDSGAGTDSDSHYLLVGAEHQFSSQTVGVIRVGGQYFSPDSSGADSGDSSWAPYVEATIKTQVNEQFGLRGFLRYGLDGRDRGIWTNDSDEAGVYGVFDERATLRIGTQASYEVSPTFTVFGGINYINTQYNDGSAGVSDFDESIFNVNLGASLQVAENVYVTGSYNYTDSDSDSDIRSYDRNRVQLGVQASF